MFLGFIPGLTPTNVSSEFDWTILTINRLRNVNSTGERFEILNQLMGELTRFRQLSLIEQWFSHFFCESNQAYVYSIAELRALCQWLDTERKRLKQYKTLVLASESIILPMLSSVKHVKETIQHIIFMREEKHECFA